MPLMRTRPYFLQRTGLEMKLPCDGQGSSPSEGWRPQHAFSEDNDTPHPMYRCSEKSRIRGPGPEHVLTRHKITRKFHSSGLYSIPRAKSRAGYYFSARANGSGPNHRCRREHKTVTEGAARVEGHVVTLKIIIRYKKALQKHWTLKRVKPGKLLKTAKSMKKLLFEYLIAPHEAAEFSY